MTSKDGTPPQSSSPAPQGSLRLPKQRIAADGQSLMTSSITSLPYRSSVSSVFASTATLTDSRSHSPGGLPTSSRDLAGSVFVTTPVEDLPQVSKSKEFEIPRRLILQGFVPNIAVYTSSDTEELTRDKGFQNGLWQLLRPFGEKIQGKVTIRDSIGLSKVCEDFAVRFVKLGDGLEIPYRPGSGSRISEGQAVTTNGTSGPAISSITLGASRTGGDIDMVENVVDKHLAYSEASAGFQQGEYWKQPVADEQPMSPFYGLYLRKLLSGMPLVPHETFSHPVACIIAISSRNTNPIETLRRLYDESTRGEKRLPLWVNGDYLRYYVLVHDEERDDVSKSITLFDQMKRHFGLHCHLLRLRSTQCVPTDDDSCPLPPCEWTSAAEDMAEIRAKEFQEDIEDISLCIFESDATAIRTFIREMVTQSVVPSMERSISTWNDQVASRRRGIGGRILNVTKKWNYFGSGSRTASGGGAGTTGSNSNYDSVQGFYRPEAQEAVMRKLADYAFMLRDWKMAQSIYDLLRTDFNGDKAWKYHAAANEMAAISSLLIPQAISSKVRSETIDQMLETASYSYLTRCSAPYGALRGLSLGMELLRVRPGSAADDAARWGSRLLESQVLGAIGEALFKERVAVCYSTQRGTGSGAWGARSRKAALWNILAANEWLNLGKYMQASNCLNDVRRLYERLPNRDCLSHFSAANGFLISLERELQVAASPVDARDGQQSILDEEPSNVDEESEALDVKSHRKSIIGGIAPALSSLETAPLHNLQADVENMDVRDDNFE